MEDLWKDIQPSTLRENPSTTASIFQDFLSPAPSPLSAATSKNKRVFVDQPKTHDSGSDLRHKRMMKNRESASRSRARRQAYTSELEREVAQLMEENAHLRNHLQKLVLYGPADKPKKCSHTRSLTAPF